MLVLTRRINEEIVIGDKIRIKVTAIQGDRVRIGLSAPPDVRIDRAEIHAKRQEPDVPLVVEAIKVETPRTDISRPARPRSAQIRSRS